MPVYLSVALVAAAAMGSLLFSTLTYALRDLSRVRLAERLEQRGASRWLEPTIEYLGDLVLVTAVSRLICNTAVLLIVLEALHGRLHSEAMAVVLAAAIGLVISFFCSVALPHALADSAGDAIVGISVRQLHTMRWAFQPIAAIIHAIQRGVREATGESSPQATERMEQQMEQEILSVVEEGEKEGVVDEQAREMIESVIGFGDTTTAQIMTPRANVVAIEESASLLRVRQTIEESGHSRIPVYQRTLDQVVGILYARDLLHYLGNAGEGPSADEFSPSKVMRPPVFIPETKPLRDLLRDFRMQKVHIAVVLDEYGGTAGLVTIEDLLEELVGDISDEHEPVEPSMFKRIDEQTAEVDARLRLEELNHLTGLRLPEDAGYETVGGYVSTTVGRIPTVGTTFESDGARFTVLSAEPQRVNRVRVQQLTEAATTSAVSQA